MPSAAATAAGLATGPGSRVTRFAKSTAASVTPVRPGKTHALSALENAMERHTVHLVLYYHAAPGVDRERLKESLSEVLSTYPAMTGRLTRGEGGESGAAAGRGWIVKCNDAGVRVVDARAAATLDEWLATASGDEEMDLAYYEPMGSEPFIWSPFYIQLTEFADKSYALGLSCTHVHNDPTAAALFLHAWAATHRRNTSPYPPFLHSPAFAVSPASPPPPPPLLAAKSTIPPNTDAAVAAMSSATFHFPASAMRALLSSLEPDTTPFAALAALFWLRVTAEAAGERELTLALDFRKLMHAPLPTGYYGSAVHFTRGRRAGGGAVDRRGVAARAADRRQGAIPDVRAGAHVHGAGPRAHVRGGVRGRGATGERVVPRRRGGRRGAGDRHARGRGGRGEGRGCDAAGGGDSKDLPRRRGAPVRRRGGARGEGANGGPGPVGRQPNKHCCSAVVVGFPILYLMMMM